MQSLPHFVSEAIKNHRWNVEELLEPIRTPIWKNQTPNLWSLYRTDSAIKITKVPKLRVVFVVMREASRNLVPYELGRLNSGLFCVDLR